MTVIFTLTFMCTLAAVGVSVDYMNVLNAQQQLSSNADATVLAAISSAVAAERKGKVKSDDDDSTSKVAEAAKKSARAVWDNNVSGLMLKPGSTPAITVKKTGTVWAAKVAYDENVNTVLLGIFGTKSVRVQGSSESTSDIGKNKEFWDYSIAVDVSSSMGLGATPAVMSAMMADPKIGCSFACHWDSSNKNDSLAIAHAAGYKLRIDIVDEAVDGMISTMKAAAVDNNITAALFGIENSIKKFVSPTTDLQSIADYNIDIELSNASKGNTNYHASMAALTGQVGKSGDGTSDKNPKKAVFLVTDGVHDSIVSTPDTVSHIYDHYDGPMDPAFCTKLKENGVKVGVLYIDYYVQSGYGGYISAFQSQMLPNLKACASDGLFFNATSPEGIKKAMNDMLIATMKASDVRLTN